jgi:small GTP-binding protein
MDKSYQIIVQGCGGVGKSAITIQFVQNVFVSKYDPTIEDSYRKPFQVGAEHVMLEIIDTAGTEQFSAMRDLYMKNGDGFLLVFSLAAKSSFVELDKLRREILQVKNSPDVPMILAANKCDLAKAEWEVAEAELERASKEWKIPYMLTSAKTKHNVENLFTTLAKQIMKESATAAPTAKKGGPCILL